MVEKFPFIFCTLLIANHLAHTTPDHIILLRHIGLDHLIIWLMAVVTKRKRRNAKEPLNLHLDTRERNQKEKNYNVRNTNLIVAPAV